ncbi:MAG: septum formation initiator family protein [Clostridia bacterium]|nr:septum formation initiator family protein [Clostridia bacterium]
MKNIFSGKLIKKVLLVGVIVYVAITLINQQKTLDSYNSAKKYNEQKLEQEKEYQESLLAMQENINSTEYIEQIARDKLYMYLPNERVYIDRSKQ